MTNREARQLVRGLVNQWADDMQNKVVVGGPIKDDGDVVRVRRAFRQVAIRMAVATAKSEQRIAAHDPAERAEPE